MDNVKQLDSGHDFPRYYRNKVVDRTDNHKIERRIKILVVEDVPINQKVAQLFLTDLGYEVDIAANGEQALAMLKPDYSLILMDLGLPDIDGITLAKRIRGQNNAIPIIACTANSAVYKKSCLDAGMDDFIVKPIMQQELKQVLDKFLIAKK